MLLDYVAALGVHLTWGCQPVFTRYLQFAAGLETVPLLLASQGLSFACLLLSLVFGRACGPATREEKPPTWSPSKRAAFAVAYGCATAARASTNMASAAMTEAWHVTLVALLGPFVTALLSRAALGERVPRALWPCVVVASGGAALAASGEARAGRFRRRDALGCGLQLVSMVFSGSARVLMKLSAGSFSTKTLMVVQYVTICGGAAAYVAFVGDARAALASFASLDAAGLVVLCALSLVVSFGAAEAQIVCIRWLGPAHYTTLQPARVLSTVGVGALLLGERLAGRRQVGGLAVVIVALGAFLAVRARRPAAAPAARDAPPELEDPGTYAPVLNGDGGAFSIGDDDDDEGVHPGDEDV